jgi:methionyl-tRNA synthetase
MSEAIEQAEQEAKAKAAVAAGTAAPVVSEGTVAPAPAPAPAAAEGEAPVDNTIGIEDFIKVELRVAQVLSAERIPKADKLLNLRVSLGDEERTVLAGMAEYYEPEALVGRKVVMVVNLAPRKMRGLISQGMLLAAEADGVVSLLQPDQDLPAGAKIR